FIDAAEPLDSLTAQLQRYLDGYELRRREELLQLVEKVTRQVIRCELTLQPTQLLTLVEEALSSLPQIPDQLKVYLNPEEFRRISEAEPDKAREWGLCADADMAPGECRVVTDTSEMDVGCQHRLDQCMDVLQSSLLPDTADELVA
ncbi:MAG: flagellar assembly protein H, partial [Enterobacterales bacterium]|nr:flagellar assembly protein H [Enterobacterales bacterium]